MINQNKLNEAIKKAKMSEFNLSEKILDKETEDGQGDIYVTKLLLDVEDVKEFIKRETSLLSDLLEKKITWAEFDEKRAKLAGEKLTKQEVSKND